MNKLTAFGVKLGNDWSKRTFIQKAWFIAWVITGIIGLVLIYTSDMEMTRELVTAKPSFIYGLLFIVLFFVSNELLNKTKC